MIFSTLTDGPVCACSCTYRPGVREVHGAPHGVGRAPVGGRVAGGDGPRPRVMEQTERLRLHVHRRAAAADEVSIDAR